jgi:hypothetical protein
LPVVQFWFETSERRPLPGVHGSARYTKMAESLTQPSKFLLGLPMTRDQKNSFYRAAFGVVLAVAVIGAMFAVQALAP